MPATTQWRINVCQTYEFDGDLLVVQQVGAFEYDTEGALSNLLPDAIVNTNDIAAA